MIYDRKCETFENDDKKATLQDLEIGNETSEVLKTSNNFLSLHLSLTSKSNNFDGKYLKVEKNEKLNSPKYIQASPNDDEVLLKNKYMDFDLKCATSFFEFLGLKKITPKKTEFSENEMKLSNGFDTSLDEKYLKRENSDTDGMPQSPGVIHERPKGLNGNDVSSLGNSPPFHATLQTTLFPTKSEHDSNNDISYNDTQKDCGKIK